MAGDALLLELRKMASGNSDEPANAAIIAQAINYCKLHGVRQTPASVKRAGRVLRGYTFFNPDSTNTG
jgi:hypothetical protein